MIICEKLHNQTSFAWLALLGCEVLTVCINVSQKKKPTQNHHRHTISTHITGDVFAFLSHKILIYPWRAGIFSTLSNINAEFEWLTQEEALILSPWRPSNGTTVGGGLHKPSSSWPWLGHGLCLTWLWLCFFEGCWLLGWDGQLEDTQRDKEEGGHLYLLLLSPLSWCCPHSTFF